MPRDSQLRRVLSRAASKLKIRQDPPKNIHITYIEESSFCIHTIPFTASTTFNDVKENLSSQMGLETADSLRVIALPYGHNFYDKELADLRTFDSWDDSESLITSIEPAPSHLKYSICGYPGAVCLKIATTPLVVLFSPWDPADIRSFAGVRNPSTTAALSCRAHQMCISQQLRILSSAFVIRGPGGGRNSEEQKAFRAAIIARYALGHPNSSHAVSDKDKQYRCQITDIYFRSDRLKASHICPSSEDGTASLIGLSSTMSEGNGLLLHASVEKVFDNFRITIIPEKEDGNIYFILRVLSSRLLTSRGFPADRTVDSNEEALPSIRWGDLDRKKITFSTESDITPYKRALYWHARVAKYHLNRSNFAEDIELSFSTFASEEAMQFARLLSSGFSSLDSLVGVGRGQSTASLDVRDGQIHVAPPPGLSMQSENPPRDGDKNVGRTRRRRRRFCSFQRMAQTFFRYTMED
ncbi:hypothetical protein TWF788_011359 [Orbilia oligospora]|uniref:HNH nuclease domain-containing protein n=1 Tax=Orbilia oligospora TaxID=2813651 RepID=A0A7C8K8T0_ORBOL|nr:hypothetical protein TWF788_011359 [Orbilia oligospora]